MKNEGPGPIAKALARMALALVEHDRQKAVAAAPDRSAPAGKGTRRSKRIYIPSDAGTDEDIAKRLIEFVDDELETRRE